MHQPPLVTYPHSFAIMVDSYGRRIYRLEMARRLPYGNTRSDRIRRLLGLPSLAERDLRRRLYAIDGILGPHLWGSPRFSGGQYYEFSAHISDEPLSNPASLLPIVAQINIRELTVDMKVRKIFMEAFDYFSPELERLERQAAQAEPDNCHRVKRCAQG